MLVFLCVWFFYNFSIILLRVFFRYMSFLFADKTCNIWFHGVLSTLYNSPVIKYHLLEGFWNKPFNLSCIGFWKFWLVQIFFVRDQWLFPRHLCGSLLLLGCLHRGVWVLTAIYWISLKPLPPTTITGHLLGGASMSCVSPQKGPSVTIRQERRVGKTADAGWDGEEYEEENKFSSRGHTGHVSLATCCSYHVWPFVSRIPAWEAPLVSVGSGASRHCATGRLTGWCPCRCRSTGAPWHRPPVGTGLRRLWGESLGSPH